MLPHALIVKPSVILPIQYLRGVAALMVVWHHSREQLPGAQTLLPGSFGASGVDLFFVISGFIMVVTTTGTETRPWQFLRRRIVRVVPLYWLLTIAMVGIALIAPSLFRSLKVSPVTLVQSLLFIPHFSQSFPDKVWPLLVPGWTLNYEMFFYAVFAASLWLPTRARLLAMAALLMAFIAVGLAFEPFGSASARTYTNPILLEFIAGALIARAWLSGRLRLPLVASLLLMVLGAALLVLRDQGPLGEFMQIIGAAVAVISALNASLATWQSRVLRILGDSSYSLYLTHIFTLGALRVIWSKALPATPTLASACAFVLLSLLLCALMGWLTCLCVETPLLRLLSKSRREPASIARARAAG